MSDSTAYLIRVTEENTNEPPRDGQRVDMHYSDGNDLSATVALDAITGDLADDLAVECLHEFEGDPMGMMVWQHVSDLEFLALVARDVLVPAYVRWGPDARQWPMTNDLDDVTTGGQFSQGPLSICRDRWAMMNIGLFVPEAEIDHYEQDEVDHGPRDVTFCHQWDYGVLAGYLQMVV